MTQHPETIAVIGAGIMGIMSAYTLIKSFPDATVILHDKEGFPAKNASFIAGGMLSPFSELDHMPAKYLSAGFSAIKTWKSISDSLDDNFDLHINGSLLLTHDEDRHLLERFKSILPPSDQWQKIGATDIYKLEPALPPHNFKNGLIIKGEAHLHPQKAMQALLACVEHKNIGEIDIKTHRADWIIDCRGLYAKTSSNSLRGVKGETLIVRNADFKLSRPIRLMHPRYPLYIVPREDSIFMIGATIIESDQSDHVSIRSGMELMSALYSLHPSFGDAEILEMKAKTRPSYPDNLPYIEQRGNVISCNGLYRHGYLFAPVMSACAADIIAGKVNNFSNLFVRNDADHIKRRNA